jgi:hypothetical protein
VIKVVPACAGGSQAEQNANANNRVVRIQLSKSTFANIGMTKSATF